MIAMRRVAAPLHAQRLHRTADLPLDRLDLRWRKTSVGASPGGGPYQCCSIKR
jgi:hypothetical protein